MSMKPILFNTEMVKALMEGRKTMTRRIIKPQPSETAEMRYIIAGGRKSDIGKWQDWQQGVTDAPKWNPPYHADDILYVRETWRVKEASFPPRRCEIEYKAGGTVKFDEIIALPTAKGEWHPSIHMPKEAARIFLRVKRVSVERVQEIDNEDALKEGCTGLPCDCANKDEHGCVDCLNTGWLEDPEFEFMELWDSTIKPADLPTCGWEANPWVWVIEFERCEKPEEG